VHRSARLLGLLLLLCELSGCALFHELQPHRLRRLNRGHPPSLDPEFLSHQDRPELGSQIGISRDAAFTARAQY
jgi:hypothetical protein